MTKTPNFSIPLLVPNQANKEITVNESLLLIDALLTGSAIDLEVNEEPLIKNNGDLYVIGNNPIGTWQNKENQLAYFYQGWRYFCLPDSLGLYIKNKSARYRLINNNWQQEK